MAKTKKTIVMSVGGSLIAPKGVDTKFLIGFKKIITSFVKKGNRVIIITGGGDTARTYQAAAKKVNTKVSHADLDWVGIAATQINAELVRSIFGTYAYNSIEPNPAKKITTSKSIIVGCGYKPGSSSDYDAVVAAKTYKADMVINLSNITYVYDKDPNKYKDAKPYKEMSWKQFRGIVGTTWKPGAHLPFDPVATKMAANAEMELVIMKGSNLKNLEKLLQGKKFTGTVIS